MAAKYQSADKGLAVLELAAEVGSVGIADLTGRTSYDRVSMSVSDASRYLNHLVETGWLRLDGKGKGKMYVPGQRLLQLSRHLALDHLRMPA